MLKFGASMFFTDYSMTPGALAQALEARSFESLWATGTSRKAGETFGVFPDAFSLRRADAFLLRR